jgi:diguanylate cyclase (GGDEF)-like protein
METDRDEAQQESHAHSPETSGSGTNVPHSIPDYYRPVNVARALAEGRRIEQVLDDLTGAACALSGAHYGTIDLLDDRAQALERIAFAAAVQPDEPRPDPAFGETVGSGSLLTVWEVLGEGQPVHIAPSQPDANHRLIFPLHMGDQMFGALTLESQQALDPDPPLMDRLKSLAAEASLVVAHSRLQTRVRRSSDIDPLTGVLNHRATQEQIESLTRLAKTHVRPLSLVLVDVANFATLNDIHGYSTGDQVLTSIAHLLEQSLRQGDIIGRFGGDELLLVLPNATAPEAEIAARRLLGALQTSELRVNGQRLPVSVNIGISTFPQDGRSRSDLIEAAWAALDRSKTTGPGGLIAGWMRNAVSGMEATGLTMLDGLIAAVTRRDHYTAHHAGIVHDAVTKLAERLPLHAQDVEALRIASSYYDVGKIAIPDSILLKQGPLTDDERGIMQQHVEYGLMLIRDLPHQHEITEAVLHHHERWDGRGYPNGVAGEDIPLLGRMLAIADAWGAMITERPYRAKLDQNAAFEELRAGAGTQFDPSLVEPFITAVYRPTSQRETAPLRPEVLDAERES